MRSSFRLCNVRESVDQQEKKIKDAASGRVAKILKEVGVSGTTMKREQVHAGVWWVREHPKAQSFAVMDISAGAILIARIPP